MLQEELACLCGPRYLSDEHMSCVIQKLNSVQSVLCIYANFVADIERSCERQVESGQYKKITFYFQYWIHQNYGTKWFDRLPLLHLCVR